MMKGGIGQIMQQVQKMQASMQEAQQELADMRVTGESGGGMVKVTMSGRHEVSEVSIDDSLIGEDREMLEDLLAAACNDAVRRVREQTESKMAGLTGGLNLPPGFNLPF
ncbi:MAG: YbaB/EbfC family nucleoid-associated protein [Pseudomonadota bacterium]